MYKTNLRKVGGSVMLAVPPAVLDLLGLQAGAAVGLEVADGRLVVVPQERSRYTLADLLERCDETAPLSDEDIDWLRDAAVGTELL